jgi:hypothetical protein
MSVETKRGRRKPPEKPREPKGVEKLEEKPEEKTAQKPSGKKPSYLFRGLVVLVVVAGAAYGARSFWLPYAETTSLPAWAVSFLQEKQGETNQATTPPAPQDQVAAAPEEPEETVTPPDETPSAPPPDLSDNNVLAVLDARLSSIETTIVAIQKIQRDQQSAPKVDLQPLTKALEDMSHRLGTLETLQAEMREEINERARLREESPAYGKNIEAQASILAIGQFAKVVQSGAPFVSEMETIKAVSGLGELVAPLVAYAPSGVATLDRLQNDFREIAKEIVAGDQASPQQDASWISQATSQLSQLVRVRKIDAGSKEAITDAALKALERGDLDSAVAALGRLDDAAAEAKAAPWLDRAKARQVADRLISDLRIRALSLAKPVAGSTESE